MLINSGNNVVNPNGVKIFGDAGGKFSAILSGIGHLQLQWSSNNSGSNGVSTCNLTLVPGTVYHLAAVWQSGAQYYYLNGVQVQADTQAGSIGVLGDSASHAFRLGSDSAGTDVSIDEVTLWVGYALSAQDVVNLRDRVVHPEGISAASIALDWSLDGPGGVAANVGDAALTDTSTTGLNLSSIVGSAPVYQAGVLTYVPPVKIGRAFVSGSGKSIGLIFQDGLGNNTNVTAIRSSDEIQSIASNGLPKGGKFTLTFEGQTTAPIAVTVSQPLIYGLFTIPVTAGVPVHVSATWTSGGSYSCAQVLYELIDGSNVVASRLVSQQVLPADFTEGTYPSGGAVPWGVISGSLTPSSSTLMVRITANAPNFFVIDGVRVKNLNSGAVAYYDDAAPQYSSPNGGSHSVTGGGAFDGTETIFDTGSGTGPIYTIDPVALQAALVALPSIGTSGVSVTAIGASNSGPYHVEWVGPNANETWPLLVSSDPAVIVSEFVAGGQIPTISINGGAAILLKDWIWGANFTLPYIPAYCPYAMSPLPQSFTSPQVACAGDFGFTNNSYWGPVPGVTTSLSGAPLLSYAGSAGQSVSFSYQQLPPGTYQLATTWPAVSGLSTTSQFLIEDGSGNTLSTVVVDQSKAPNDYTSNGFGWKILGTFTADYFHTSLTLVLTTNGGGPLPVAIDAFQITRTSPDTSIVIQPTDSLTITIPTGWATTQAGAVPALANLAVTNLAGGSTLPPFVATTKTLKPGYNVEVDAENQNLLTYSNLAVRLANNIGLAQNANGYPTKLSANSRNYQNRVVSSFNRLATGGGDQGTHKGIANLPSGLYTLTWDGASDIQFNSASTGTEVVASRNLTGTTGNRRVYNIQAPPSSYSPTIYLDIFGTTPDPADPSGNTYLCDVSNLSIYPPDPSDLTGNTQWVNPPKFHPTLIYKLQGARCLRFLDPLATNNIPYASYSQIKPVTALNRASGYININVPVAKIQQPNGNPFFCNTSTVVQITTTTPHGLFDGAVIHLTNCGTAAFSDGSQIALNDPNVAQGLVHVVDQTNVIFHPYTGYNTSPISMTNVLTGGNLAAYSIGTIFPLQDIVDLVAQVGATDLWFNVAGTADTSVGGCVDQIAQFLATNLPTGVKVHVEYANECWNGEFFTYLWCRALTAIANGKDDQTYQLAYVQKAMAVHARFDAVFTANGRAGDVIYTYCTQGANTGVTDAIASIAQAAGARIDELGVGIYFDNDDIQNGFPTSQIDIANRLSPDHCVDLLELNAEYGRFETFVSNHLPYLAKYGYSNTKMVTYEAAPDILIPPNLAPPPGSIPNYFSRQNAVKRHPRMYGIILRILQKCQDAGLTIWNQFNLGDVEGGYAWETYEGWNQQRGTGDMNLDSINATNPNAMDQVKSEVGGALYYWSTLTNPTKPVSKQHTIPGRNGLIKSIGLPRGVLRTTR